MTYATKATQEQLDFGFLLLTHIICADRQIHSEESKYLRELSDRVIKYLDERTNKNSSGI
jgi:hypothetical protein